MPTFRVNFFFSEFKQGWVETWYIDQASLAAATVKGNLLAPILTGPRTIHTNCDAMRIIQVNPPVPRRGALVAINQTGSRPDGVPLFSEAEDVVQTCAFMQAQFLDGSKRTAMLRGLADTDVVRDPGTGRSLPTVALNGLLNVLQAQLSADNWELRRYASAIVGTVVNKIDADPVNSQFTRLTGPGSPAYNVGDPIHFTGVPLPQVPWLKGQWQVKATTLTSVSIAYVYPLGAPVLPLRMFQWPSQYTYVPFNGWTFRDFRTRKTGRPTGLTRGRSSGVSFRR
jgi:hypothetical protein